jgi:putative oxidoreductase
MAMFTMIDQLAAKVADVALLVGRIAIAVLFIPAGFGKLTGIGGAGISGFTQYLTTRGVPAPGILAWLAALTEFLGGIALALGLKTRLTALIVIGFTIVATLIGHRYWEMQDALRVQNYGNFWKNVAIIGGLLAYFVRGGGAYSLDRK